MKKKIIFCVIPLLSIAVMIVGMDKRYHVKKYFSTVPKKDESDKLKIEHLSDVPKIKNCLHDYQEKKQDGFAKEQTKEIMSQKK